MRYPLFDLALELADYLREEPPELGLECTDEAQLRACLAAAKYARRAYRSIRAAAKDSATARQFLKQARTARLRTEQNLRRRIDDLIADRGLMLDDAALALSA